MRAHALILVVFLTVAATGVALEGPGAGAIITQFNTQYVPFFLTFPPHSGQGQVSFCGPGFAGVSAACLLGFGPGL